jgi:uroporphyrinogen-III synthase
VTHRRAYGYLSLPRPRRPDVEIRLRRRLAEFAALEGLDLASIFVDEREESPYGFAALRELLRRTDVHAVVLPSLARVRHIAAVAPLTQADLARYLNAAVLLAVVEPGAAATRPAGHATRRW